ncbi:hypothetical protein GcM3_025035 [Golovinomyces cichoracearum]|uniref:Uncharacterized protein n=1 Tax=Golovinomyces cichoracearum TaxID=62708 RepID=A0A420J6D9_9PEZI|nr:hypothetical protein GcM3_025035 [Golovinomyces cichoracearum]
MYRDKRISISNPSVHRLNPSPSVSTATSLTFQKLQIPNVSMSSAAAAAALRSQPSSPTSVADVKTKRMLRRSSISSNRSQSSISGDFSRQRKWSSGSMSRRSSRDFNSEQPGEVKSINYVPPESNIIQQKILENVESSITSTAGRLSSLNSERSISSSNGPSLISCNRSHGSNPSISRTSVNFSLPTESRPISPVIQRKFKSPLNMNPINIHASDDQGMTHDLKSRRLHPKSEISEFDFTNISSPRKAMRESFTQSNSLAKEVYPTVERNLEYELNSMLPTLLEVDKEKSTCLIQNEQKKYSNSPVNVQDNLSTASDTNQGWISSSPQVSVPNTRQQKRQPLASTDSADNPKMSILRENSSLQINQNFKNEISNHSQYRDKNTEPNDFLTRGSNSAAITERSFLENEYQPLAVAPRKSALKYMRPSHINFASARNTNDAFIEEPSLLKKKATRVSFGDKALIVDEEDPKLHTSLTESELQTNHFVLDSSKENTRDEPLKLHEDEVMKPRPKLPYFGSVRLEKKSQELEKRCTVSPVESFNHNLSSVPAAPHAFPEVKKSKIKTRLDDQLVVSDLGQETDIKKIGNVSIGHGEYSSEKKYINDSTNDSEHYRENINVLQDSQEIEKVMTMGVSYISEDREAASRNSLKDLNINYSTTSLTSIGTPKNNSSSSPSLNGTPRRQKDGAHPEILHIPGAWETSTIDSDRSLGSNHPLNFESSGPSEKSTVDRSVNNIASGNFQESYKGISSGPEISHNSLIRPVALEVEDESESESVYCDAMEYVSDAENSSSTRTSIIVNSTAENVYFNSKPAVFPLAINSLHLNLPNGTTPNEFQRLDKAVDKTNPIEIITSGMIRTVAESNSIEKEQKSESKTDDYHTKNQEKSQRHRPFSLPLKPQVGLAAVEDPTKSSSIMGKLINSENYITHNPTILSKSQLQKSLGNGVDNFYQKRPTDKKIKLKDSMRRDESSYQMSIRSPSSASKTSRRSAPYKVSPVRKKIRFRFSRLGRSHFSRPTEERGSHRQSSRFSETSDDENQIRSTFKSRFIDSSDEEITPDRQLKPSDSSFEIPKFPIIQSYEHGILKNKPHSNKISHSEFLVPQHTQVDESSLNSNSKKKRYNTCNISSLDQSHRKKKGHIISILRKKKTSFNDNFRRTDSRKLSVLDVKDRSSHTEKISNAHSISEAKNAENKSALRLLHLSDVPIPAVRERKISTTDRNPLRGVTDEGAATKKNVKILNVPSNSRGNILSLDSSRKKKIAPLRKIFRLDK